MPRSNSCRWRLGASPRHDGPRELGRVPHTPEAVLAGSSGTPTHRQAAPRRAPCGPPAAATPAPGDLQAGCVNPRAATASAPGPAAVAPPTVPQQRLGARATMPSSSAAASGSTPSSTAPTSRGACTASSPAGPPCIQSCLGVLRFRVTLHARSRDSRACPLTNRRTPSDRWGSRALSQNQIGSIFVRSGRHVCMSNRVSVDSGVPPRSRLDIGFATFQPQNPPFVHITRFIRRMSKRAGVPSGSSVRRFGAS